MSDLRPLNRLLLSMDAEVFELISPHLVRATLDRGAVLYEPDDGVDTIYFPDNAILCLMTLLQSGAAIENAIIGREGAMGLRAMAAPRRAWSRVVVHAGGEAWLAEAEPLRRLWRGSETFRDLTERHNEALIAQTSQSVACNAVHSVEARLARWLLDCHDRSDNGALALTQEFLADILGVQRTTITAVARSMQAAGLIRYSRGQLEILDRDGLQAAACECYRTVRQAYGRLLPASFD